MSVLKSCLCAPLTSSLAVVVVGVETSLQHLRNFVHLTVLDEFDELPQICLHNNMREISVTVRRKNTNGGGCERENGRIRVQSCKKTEIEVELEKGVKVQTQLRENEKWKCSGIQCKSEGGQWNQEAQEDSECGDPFCSAPVCLLSRPRDKNR